MRCFSSMNSPSLVDILFYLFTLVQFNVFYVATVGKSSGSRNTGDRTTKDTNVLMREEALTTDLAHRGRAEQSSTIKASDYAFSAIDRVSHTCAKTKSERGAWWRVHLRQVYEIWAVVIARCGKWNQ